MYNAPIFTAYIPPVAAVNNSNFNVPPYNICAIAPPPPPPKASSILQKTTNLIDLFLHLYCYVEQKTQTPKSFLTWACLTLISAAVQDRFFIRKFQHKLIKPNIYVFLVGPSGLGKDFTCDTMKVYLAQHDNIIRIYDGKLTHAYWWDFLTGGKRRSKSKSKPQTAATAFLLTPELKHSLGSKGALADAFVAQMTALYDKEGEVSDGSRLWGGSTLRDPCITWLSGSTLDWLFDTIDTKEIAGGYAARVIWIVEDYDVSRIHPAPTYPPDFEEVHQYLMARIMSLVYSPGAELRMSVEARAFHDEWLNDREVPDDQLMLPTFHREPVLLLKLAILCCLADGSSMEIQLSHLQQAADFVEELRDRHLPRLLQTANKSPKILDIEHVEAVLRNADNYIMDRTTLIRRVHSRGMDVKRLDASLLDLMQAGAVTQMINGRTMFYKWNENKKLTKELHKVKIQKRRAGKA